MEDQRKKCDPWSMHEVQTFLCVVAKDRIQKELDGATRNEKVFQEVSQAMANQGYHRTSQQCRDKLKKLKSDYRQVKDHNSRGGSKRKTWKWFDQMDAIYGHRQANQRKENGLDTTTSLLCVAYPIASVCATDEVSVAALSEDSPTSLVSEPTLASTPAPPAVSPPRPHTGKRKRSLFQEQISILRDMQASDEDQQERNRAQRERHIQAMMDDMREARQQEMEARQQEMAIRREEATQAAAFNQALLGVLGQLAQAIAGRNAAQPPQE